MQTDIKDIQSFLKNKRIVLLGNSQSIMNNKKDIDAFDVVIRINRGISNSRTADFIGKRTDILCIATHISEVKFKDCNPKYVLWMTECTKLADKWISDVAYQNPIEDWREAKSLIPDNKFPSTGLLVIKFLDKYINFESLTIYGFDCFETGTWYHRVLQPWHLGNTEKEIITSLVFHRENIKWIRE